MSTYCPFCDKAQQYRYIYESKYARIMYPLNPAGAYHTLITPSRHIEHLHELSISEWEEFGKLLRLLHKKASANIDRYIGYNILSNNGDKRINQQVQHCHMHVFLRTSDDLSNPLTKPHSAVYELSDEQKKSLAQLQALF